MNTQTIDYDALAKQAGAIDYDALAKQAGAAEPTASAKPAGSWLGMPGTQMEDAQRDVLIRELKAVGNTIKNTPGAVFHAFSDEPNKDEANKHGTDRLGLAIDRLIAQPLKTAVSTYADAARGKVPDLGGQALDVAPEALGSAGGQVLFGKALEGAPALARAVPEAASRAVSATADIAPRVGKAAWAGTKAAAAHVPIVGPITKAGLQAAVESWKNGAPKPSPTLPEPAESVYPELGPAEPENAEPNLQQQSQNKIESPQVSYPGVLQKRPTNRAEITDDKAVEDAMRNDLEKQGWRALSQERKEFYANNQPGMAKGDLITNARVEAVRTAAEQQVQKILAEANPPVKYSKTVIPKAKVAAPAQPVAEDLNSPNRLIDLMQQSIDALNARKGNK